MPNVSTQEPEHGFYVSTRVETKGNGGVAMARDGKFSKTQAFKASVIG